MRAALYARYSSDRQSEASIPDQFRECRRIAERFEFEVVSEFSDAAISGGTARRPGYQSMLEAARRGDFDVIVAEDTSRLWRNMAEQAPRLAELTDLGVAVVTQDLDSRTETAAILGAVNGAMSEQYRREIGRRTRRGLEGCARAQKTTGGRAYGYHTIEGERRINAEQAAIVREIFERIACGDSMRAICADLNARGVPSPAADWKRTRRPRDGKWRVSAVHSMLKNEAYIGRMIWNRCRWVRSATDSSKRRRVENPPSKWIVHERPDLAIVDADTWERVHARMAEQAEMFSSGLRARSTYLLSGILRCAVCGGAFVISAHRPVRYGCSTHRHAGATVCGNGLLVRADVAEAHILAYVSNRLLSPEAIELAVAAMREAARTENEAPPPDLSRIDAEIAELERLRSSGLVSAETIAPALERAYRQREREERRPAKRAIAAMFGAEREYREMLAAVREAIESDDVAVVREALREVLGTVPLHPQGKTLVAELRAERLVMVSGSSTALVAGARDFIELTGPAPRL